MNAAERVIQKFGGQTVVARLIGKGQTTVQYWTRSGIIPAKWHKELLRLAQEQGVELSPHDFLSSEVEEGVADAVLQVDEPQAGGLPIPEAKWFGRLQIGDAELPCFVLNDGRRIISRTGATSVLAGKKGGGQLEKYVRTSPLPEYMPPDLPDKMIDFQLKEVTNKEVRGIEAETFLEICRGYVRALTEKKLRTESQIEMAGKASLFLAACAKVGLIALIDEATGYQYARSSDALQVKLMAFLSDKMRTWEKTFPDELWIEFGRLTNWRGSVTQRPKYWGKLVTELIYEYLDLDVAQWLKEHVPKPRHGQNYHQWLSSQYGLKKLTEHIWMVIGMARVSKTMMELREKMATNLGGQLVQMTILVPPARPVEKLPLFPDDLETDEHTRGKQATEGQEST